MSDLLVVSLTVTPSGGTAHELEDRANGYEVFSYGIGKSSVDKVVSDSQDMDGHLLVAHKRAVILSHVGVRVWGATAAQVDTRAETLKGWFAEPDFVITATVSAVGDGVNTRVDKWLCEPASWEESGGDLDPELFGNHCTEYLFEFDHDPIQLP